MSENPIKVLLAKPGLDGHSRGVHVILDALRDAGMEVVFAGIRRRPVEIATAAVEEDVDVVGLSCLSGAHIPLFPETAKLVREQMGDKVILIGGGIIPEEDHTALIKAGFSKIYGPGADTREIVEFIKGSVK
ncbi:MAG: cobalamin B12-binding domain-containing protein [Planctomycetota bacterium]|jgi:methylmalonyl-CoA mutase C-terminal domain/subunit